MISASPFAHDCARVWVMTSGCRAKRLFDCYRTPGLHALAAYRLGRWCLTLPWWRRWPVELLYQYLAHRVAVKWGIELCRSAQIGPGCSIEHFGGIIVGAATLGHSCTISQGVTIGGAGHGEHGGYPTLGDTVFVGPGAKVFGPIRIGSRVKIGANAVVHRDIPDDTVVALMPGFTVLNAHAPDAPYRRPSVRRPWPSLRR